MNAKIEKNELNKVHKIGTRKNSVKKDVLFNRKHNNRSRKVGIPICRARAPT